MSGAAAVERYVTSRDGTRLGFLSQGSGPGLVLVQGAMGVAQDYRELAAALAPHVTVHALDRRGRGLSTRPYDAGHTVARDVEDLDAVLAETGSRWVFGLSSGAVITLEAARTLSRISAAAVYEPPFYAEGISHRGVEQLNGDLERGDLASALVRSLLVAQTAPHLVRVLPFPLARLLARAVLAVDRHRPGRHPTLADLLPGIRYDFTVVEAADGTLPSFATLDKPVLLISGTASPGFLGRSIRALDEVLPQSRHVELEGLGHSGPWNRSRGGRPAEVAAVLRDFFL